MRQMLLQILLCDPFATFLLIINLVVILFLSSSRLCHLDQFGGSDLCPVSLLPVQFLLLSPLVRAARLPVLCHTVPFVVRVGSRGILSLTTVFLVTVGIGARVRILLIVELLVVCIEVGWAELSKWLRLLFDQIVLLLLSCKLDAHGDDLGVDLRQVVVVAGVFREILNLNEVLAVEPRRDIFDV